MIRINAVCLMLLLFIVALGQTAGKQPRAEVLGVRLNMNEDEAHTRLQKIGHQQKEEREREGEGEQEVWLLSPDRDQLFSYLVVKFDGGHQVKFITAVARKDRQVRYGDLADLKSARRATDGINYSYTWKIAAERNQAACIMVARGSDPQYLTSYTISRLSQ